MSYGHGPSATLDLDRRLPIVLNWADDGDLASFLFKLRFRCRGTTPLTTSLTLYLTSPILKWLLTWCEYDVLILPATFYGECHVPDKKCGTESVALDKGPEACLSRARAGDTMLSDGESDGDQDTHQRERPEVRKPERVAECDQRDPAASTRPRANRGGRT